MAQSIIHPDRLVEVEFSNDEIARYSRHLIMPEVTLEGQRRLKAGKVLCIGAGGLGSPIAMYLSAAGVGTIGLIDYDVVDFSNLQRQIIHTTPNVGRKKTRSAKDAIKAINPNVEVVLHETLFRSDNAMDLVEPYDIVIDGTDNFATRYLSNDVCVWQKKPNIYGSIFRFDGQITVFAPHLGGPCYRCMFPEPPPPGEVPTCAEGGVLGVLPGIVGVIQATEAVKLLMGVGNSLIGRLLHYDALAMKFREFKLRRDPKCPVCGDSPSIFEPIDYDQFCGTPQADLATKANRERITSLPVAELKRRLDAAEKFIFLDIRDAHEAKICGIPGAQLLPISELHARLAEFDSADEFILICRNGERSASAAQMMQDAGFRRVSNITGGLHAWADKIDPTMPKY